MLVAKKIRLEISEQDAAALEFMQGKCRGLYNWWVTRLRNGEKWPRWEEAKKTLQQSKEYDPELRHVYGKLLHEVYFRLDAAVSAFFCRVENGEKPGFPRVRPRRNFFTLCYPAMYIKVKGNTVTLPTGGGGKHGPKRYPDIVARLTEEAPTCYKEVAISRDGQGHYYASFVHEEQEETRENNGVLALDKQQDCLHKASHLIAHQLVESTVVIGDHALRQMVMKKKEEETPKEKRKRRIRNRLVYNDWGLYSFVQMLTYKCLLSGKELHIIDERDTTKTCHKCQQTQDMPLWKRVYRCSNENCGLIMDRDDNSAINILMRFLARLGPHA